MRYVELNPVRANMAKDPSDFRWSSFRANACGAHDRLVTPHAIYDRMGVLREERQCAYRELFGSMLAGDDVRKIREATQYGWALGGDTFQKGVSSQGRRANRLPLGRPARIAKEEGSTDDAGLFDGQRK